MGTSRKAIPYTDRHKGRGAEYHETFSPEVNPYRAMVWRLEQRALNRLLRKHLPSRSINHLDFACGTGRIVEYLIHRVSHTTGVDVSSSMLEVARKVAPAAELIEADLTQNDVLGDRSFDLITAFRFFPNAEPPLRQAVLSALSRHLAPNGVLIFNNHKNRNSLRARIVRLRGRGSVVGTMSHQDVEALLPTAGLRLVEMIPVASLPLSEKHVLLPVGVAESVEKIIGGWSALARVAQDILYVCAPGSTPQRQSKSSFSH
jgi:SAM-dependent methyltransferase